MLAHYHGQIWNTAEPARALGASESTTRRQPTDRQGDAPGHPRSGLPYTEVMQPRDQTLVDAVASATADATLGYLFGSGGTSRQRPDSDLDVAVLCSEPLGAATREDLVLRLEQATGRTVDLVDLATADPIIQRQVIASGVLVQCGDQAVRAAFEIKTLAEYLDLKIDRRDAERRLVESFS